MSRSSAIIVKGSPMTEGKRTYIVFGDMRGGTTMIAGVMRALGIHMGDDLNEDNQESHLFNGPPVPDMRESIKRHNDKYDLWGWKFPHAADYVDLLWEDIRNPHLVCVFRDGVANARGLNRWHPIGKIQALQQTLLRQQKNLNLVALRNCPSILISYEKAERNKAEFLREFSQTLGLEPDHEHFDFDGFMAAESYKKLADFVRVPGEALAPVSAEPDLQTV